jgi:hypothetical protein
MQQMDKRMESSGQVGIMQTMNRNATIGDVRNLIGSK